LRAIIPQGKHSATVNVITELQSLFIAVSVPWRGDKFGAVTLWELR
jgi:hypothetical protein